MAHRILLSPLGVNFLSVWVSDCRYRIQFLSHSAHVCACVYGNVFICLDCSAMFSFVFYSNLR